MKTRQSAGNGAYQGQTFVAPMESRACHDHTDYRHQRSRKARREEFKTDDYSQDSQRNINAHRVCLCQMLKSKEKLTEKSSPSGFQAQKPRQLVAGDLHTDT